MAAPGSPIPTGASGPPVLTAGFDIGGTKLLGVVTDASGRVVAERRRPTGLGPDAVLDDLGALFAELRLDVPGVAAIGVGAAGLVDFDGVMRYAPNLPGWVGVSIRSTVEAGTGVPVVVDNDANVAALGEVLYGAAVGRSEILVVTLGTGIGGGIVTGGRVYRGAHGFAAEIGHITIDGDRAGPRCACGGRGHWEAFASGSALGRLGREWAARGDASGVLAGAGGDVDAVTGWHVGEAARAGDPEGIAILAVFARAVAVGLGALLNVLDPKLVVIAGGLVELGDLLLRPVRAELARFVEAPAHRPMPDVVAARLGERAGAIGAAALARQWLGSRSSWP